MLKESSRLDKLGTFRENWPYADATFFFGMFFSGSTADECDFLRLDLAAM
jgi:hypothetical protein